jgi:hypothetical protein
LTSRGGYSSVGRASDCGSEGRGFEPHYSPHLLKRLIFAQKNVRLLVSFSNSIDLSGHGAIGSALALGARGCQFESGCPDHFFILSNAAHQLRNSSKQASYLLNTGHKYIGFEQATYQSP